MNKVKELYMYIAIDIGGTKIKIASYSALDYKTLVSDSKITTTGDFEQDIQNIKDVIKSFNLSIEAIGIAIPGINVNENTGIIYASNLPDWNNKDIKAALSDILNKDKIFISHDAKSNALGEIIFGNAWDNFLYVIWGTGIGGAYVKSYPNAIHIQQVELGWQKVNGVFLEELIGGKTLREKYNKSASELTSEEWQPVIEDFSQGLANVFAINYAPKIIWSGGVAVRHFDIIKKIVDKAHEEFPYYTKPEIKISTFGENAGEIGALANVKFHLEPSQRVE